MPVGTPLEHIVRGGGPVALTLWVFSSDSLGVLAPVLPQSEVFGSVQSQNMVLPQNEMFESVQSQNMVLPQNEVFESQNMILPQNEVYRTVVLPHRVRYLNLRT